MILVKRARPARSPAASAPTICLTGSLVGPVMICPRESVLTGVLKKRKGNGASAGGGIRTWNEADPGWQDDTWSAQTTRGTKPKLSAPTAHRSSQFLRLGSLLRGFGPPPAGFPCTLKVWKTPDLLNMVAPPDAACG